MTRNVARFFGIAALVVMGVALAATWKTDPKQSSLTFVGVQAGAELKGVFERFTADIRFDPKDLANSKFDVNIDMKSVTTKEKDRDETLRGPDLFSVNKWPSARYVADNFTDLGGGKFSGAGKLTIRDVTHDVTIEFTQQVDGKNSWLKGGSRLKRLDFGVGQGEWKDTQFVGNDVRVEFSLRLDPG